MGQIFYNPCTCPVLILASRNPRRTVHDLGLVHVRRSGLVLESLYLWKLFWYPVQKKINLGLVPGFEIVLVLRMLILKQGRVYQSSWACLGLGSLAIWVAVRSLKGPGHPWVSTPLLRALKADDLMVFKLSSHAKSFKEVPGSRRLSTMKESS